MCEGTPLFGTPLSNDDFELGRVLAVPGAPEARYAWDAGAAIGGYLDGLRAGKLLGRRCRKCRRPMIPPRMSCELCFRSTDAWVELRDEGRVNTFSICHITWDMKPLRRPLIPAVIEIDGASPGMGILHLVGGADPRRVRIGMRVKAVWKPAKKREGAITDIRYWKPK